MKKYDPSSVYQFRPVKTYDSVAYEYECCSCLVSRIALLITDFRVVIKVSAKSDELSI